MDTVFQALVSWQFVLFCLGIAAVTFVLRKAIEFFVLDNPKMPGTRASKFWNEFLLPVFPVVFGCLVGLFAKQYPYPDSLTSTSSHLTFGLVAGLFSGLVYRVAKAFLASKLGVVIDDADKKD
jgi:hypothetical protein